METIPKTTPAIELRGHKGKMSAETNEATARELTFGSSPTNPVGTHV
jgi:hypothetical protein